MIKSSASLFQNLQLFHGPFSPMRADLYARVPSLEPSSGFRLEGEIYGPLCERSRTLPMRSRLIDTGAGPTVLARAVVTDPCPWSPAVPAVYQIRLRLMRGSELLEQQERAFGFRAIGVAEGGLYRAGQPWVLRALGGMGEVPPMDWDELRSAELAMIVGNPSDGLCESATRHGVPLLVIPDAAGISLAEEIRRLAGFVCVVAIILPVESLPCDPHDLAPGLLFAQDLAHAEGVSPTDWADLLLVDASANPRAIQALFEGQSRAVLLQRCQSIAVDSARHEELLHELQRDTLDVGPFAGYLIRAT